jgi:hypothetical protein
MSDFVGIPTPEAPHPAAVAMGFPLADPPVISKRRSELIAPLATSIGKIWIARKLQADLTQSHWSSPGVIIFSGAAWMA